MHKLIWQPNNHHTWPCHMRHTSFKKKTSVFHDLRTCRRQSNDPGFCRFEHDRKGISSNENEDNEWNKNNLMEDTSSNNCSYQGSQSDEGGL